MNPTTKNCSLTSGQSLFHRSNAPQSLGLHWFFFFLLLSACAEKSPSLSPASNKTRNNFWQKRTSTVHGLKAPAHPATAEKERKTPKTTATGTTRLSRNSGTTLPKVEAPEQGSEVARNQKANSRNNLAAEKDRCKSVTLVVGTEPLGYRSKGLLCNGLREKTWRFEFLDGRLMRVGAYSKGQETGLWRMWYRKGGKQAKGKYANGRRVGLWTRWHTNEKKSLEGPYRNGLRHGRWRRWHRNGELFEDRVYVHGTREGTHLRWDRKGRLKLVRSCTKDVCTVLCRAKRRKACILKEGISPPGP